MVDLKEEELAKAVTEKMMKQGIFIRHLKAFGLPLCVRISTGTEAENALFVSKL
jgi:histidinol-phosphate/aromatic aminotransferase/cobyric acid decarboxylase-like protein